MIKKLLLVCAVVLGLVYGSGSDLDTVKRSLLGASDSGARNFTASDNDGWGEDSGY